MQTGPSRIQRLLQGPALMRATWMATVACGRVSGRLSEPFVRRLWFTPWRVPAGPRAVERETRWLSGSTPVTIGWSGGRLRGFEQGDGSVVMLVHGWGTRAASMGALIEPLVAAGARVVGLDLPAHGDSTGTSTDAYAMGEALRTAAAQLRPRAVVAHSFGTVVVREAARQGLTIDRLVLVAPMVRLEHAVTTFGSEFSIPPKAVEGLRRALVKRFGPDVWDEFALDRNTDGLGTRTLIVHDEHDQRVTTADAVLLRDALTNAQLMLTAGLGHDRILASPDVRTAVTRFVLET